MSAITDVLSLDIAERSGMDRPVVAALAHPMRRQGHHQNRNRDMARVAWALPASLASSSTDNMP